MSIPASASPEPSATPLQPAIRILAGRIWPFRRRAARRSVPWIPVVVIATMLTPVSGMPMQVEAATVPFQSHPVGGNIHELVTLENRS